MATPRDDMLFNLRLRPAVVAPECSLFPVGMASGPSEIEREGSGESSALAMVVGCERVSSTVSVAGVGAA